MSNDAETASLDGPSREELVARAEALIPVLRERAGECERLGRVPDATVAAFEKAGFYRILQPSRFGGYAMSPKAMFDVATTLARGCPSSAWCLSVVCIHTWEIAMMDPRAADDMWGGDPRVRASSSYPPLGTAEKVDGGYIVNGRWGYSSGCDHCDWIIIGILVPDENTGAPRRVVTLVPRSNYEIDPDSWHSLGMRGTGSKDLIVTDAFVPEYRTHAFSDVYQVEALRTDPSIADAYRYPFRVALSYCLSCVALGIADGALEQFAENIQGMRNLITGAKARDNPLVRRRVAEASALVDAAHMRIGRDWREMDAMIGGGTSIPTADRVRYIWNSAYNARSAVEAVNLLFVASGARAVNDTHAMQRYLRDVTVIPNHVLMNADHWSDTFGGIALGGDPEEVPL